MSPEYGWRVVAASVAGSAHLEKGLPCQDAYAFLVLPDGTFLAAVADGAGSAEHALAGARRAVEQALTGLCTFCQGNPPENEAGWQAALASLFDGVRQKLTEFANTTNTSVLAWAATLTCALVTREWLVVGQIGDGTVVVEDAQGNLILAARPQRGPYANETNFLTMPNLVEHIEIFMTRQPVQALAVTTDGLLRLAIRLPGCEPHPSFFKPLFDCVRDITDELQAQLELVDFLASERVCRRTDDDKTLLLAVRVEPGEAIVSQTPGVKDNV